MNSINISNRSIHGSISGLDDEVDRTSLVPSVARAAAILDLLGEHGAPLPSNEIARQLGIPKSSTANICLELESLGYLVRRDNGYRLGRKLVELGGKYLGSIDALREYYDLCASLPILSRESSRIAILDGTDVLYLGKYEGRQQIRLTANIGDRFPAICTATGKALMALLPPGEAEQRYRENPSAFVPLTEKSIRTVDELSKDLAAIRERGYSIDNEETTPGVICFAIAISGFRGDTSAFAVSATALVQRVTPEFRQSLLNDLFTLGKGLSNPLTTSDRH
jgi:IclR family transcriptional regulator, blcABC operon repressor